MNRFVFFAAPLLAATASQAQPYDLSWHRIASGGGISFSGTFELSGTLGQHEPGVMTGGGWVLTGGFWAGAAGTPEPCYANCDGSTVAPILNVADFGCFLQRFAAGDAYANCDGSTIPPTLNVADFGCFLQKFAAGCP